MQAAFLGLAKQGEGNGSVASPPQNQPGRQRGRQTGDKTVWCGDRPPRRAPRQTERPRLERGTRQATGGGGAILGRVGGLKSAAAAGGRMEGRRVYPGGRGTHLAPPLAAGLVAAGVLPIVQRVAVLRPTAIKWTAAKRKRHALPRPLSGAVANTWSLCAVGRRNPAVMAALIGRARVRRRPLTSLSAGLRPGRVA